MTPNLMNHESNVSKLPKPDVSFKRSLNLTEEQRSALFSHFVNEGSVTDGHTDKCLKPSEIFWINPELLKKGRDFVHKNYAWVLLVEMVSNIIGFIAKQMSAAVFHDFYPKNTCGVRYYSTFNIIINSWLLSQDFGLDNKATSRFIKDMKMVRMMHKKLKTSTRPEVKPIIPPPDLDLQKYSELVKAIKHDLRDIDTSEFIPEKFIWKPEIFFSQLDIATVQFGAIAPLLAHPKETGFYGAGYDENEEMRGFFHIWALIGKMLGLEDRFNWALYPDAELYRKVVTHLGLGGLKHVDEPVLFLMEELVEGLFGGTMPGLVTYKSLIMVTAQAFGAGEMEGLWNTMDWKDRFSYHALKAIRYLQSFSLFANIFNLFFKSVLNLYVKLFLKSK